MLTSRTYPIFITESIRVHNVQGVTDIALRNIYKKTSTETDAHNISISNPRVTSLGIRNLYNRFSQAPTDFIKLLKPTVLSLSIRNLYNRLTPARDSISISLPSITSIKVRSLLKGFRTWGLDETITVSLPNIIEIHKKDVVSSYDNSVSADFKIGLPDSVELGGSVKPVLTFPVLVGKFTEINNTLGISISWDDSSITHTGYTIYRSLEPIPEDTTQEPYLQLGRDVKQFDEPYVDEDTTYYYRVTPKTVYGNLFSNQVELSHFTDHTVTFMMQESLTYIPIRADNNIIPLVPIADTKGYALNARFEQLSVLDSTLTSEYIPAPSDIELQIYGVNTTNLIRFMVQESPTYIPLQVDNNIIPLVPSIDTMWDDLNASFEQLAVVDTDIVSGYTPTPADIEMRTYNE